MKTHYRVPATALAAMLVLAACGEESPDVEGCEHLQEGPAQAVTAATSTADAPEVKTDHQRYDVTFTDVTGGKGGVVRFASAEHNEYVLFLDADVPVKVTDSQNTALPLTSVTSSEECTEIKGRHTVTLNVGTYFFTFGPTEATKVGLVLEPGAHADEH